MNRWFKIGGLTMASVVVLLTLLLLTPFLFGDKLARVVKQTANDLLTTELAFTGMDVSFIRHFPHLTVTFSDVVLHGSAPFQNDTLIRAKEVSVGINLWSLIDGPVVLSRIYVRNGQVLIQYNEHGTPNYKVTETAGDTTLVKETDPAGEQAASGSPEIHIGHIVFSHIDLIYSDPSIPVKVIAHGMNYRGKNEMTGAVMRLNSGVTIDSLDVIYDKITYIESKPLTADLITRIDLNSLDMKFEKTNLKIKDVPFDFKGELTFKKEGYELFIALFSSYEEEYLSGSFWLVSADSLWVSVKADINITLENWVKGFGIRETDLRGTFGMKVKAEGVYATGQNPESQDPDTILLSIPDFSVTSTLKNGYYHQKTLPEAIRDISFGLSASVTNHDLRTFHLQLEELKASILKSTLEGSVRLNGLDDWPVEAVFSTHLNLADLKEALPIDSLDLKGMLNLTLDVRGNFSPEKNLFPVTTLSLDLTDGWVQTAWYPYPLEQIGIRASVVNKTGTLSGTDISLQPLSFSFQGSPFEFSGTFGNPEDIRYSVTSKGSVDLAGIYRLFSREGLDVSGSISTDLFLRGTQRDALAGAYDRLRNTGRLTLRNIAVRSEYLPLPLLIRSGVFRFENDQVWFEKFESRYGASDITMDGYLSNVINYVLNDQPLRGEFTFRSDYLLVDEFISQEQEEITVNQSNQPVPESTEGVIVIPDNLDIRLAASLKSVRFNDLNLRDLEGRVEISNGGLNLDSLSFNLIGCRVNLDATYHSLSPTKATFDLHARAMEFDVKRAYNEVELFRNLASAAGKCEGIISLDYALKGRLGDRMSPIYPSLEGGGTVTLEQVKVYGLNLFTNMAKNLENDKIANPDLSKVELKTTIKNNVITLERTKMKMAGFRFRVEGETNFDGQLNLKTRLGLPPLGIIGIPIRVLGTHEDPKFKYGRGNNDEEVEETEYTDEIPPELLNQLKKTDTR